VIFASADRLGWVLLLEPILETGPAGDAPDPLSLAGGLLHNLVYELLDHALRVPPTLESAAFGAAAAIGRGLPVVITADGNLLFANAWSFGVYDFTLSIDRDSWIATLAPRTRWLELVTLTSTAA